MPNRTFSSGSYRYGFNDKENDNEVKGEGNQQDYGMRIYDPRLGRFLSVDPLRKDYPELTPYQFASNSPIAGIDMDGGEFRFGIFGGTIGTSMLATSIGDANKYAKEGKSPVLGFVTGPLKHFASGAIGGLFAYDLMTGANVTRGVLTLYTYSQVAGAFEHNIAKTPEGRLAQNQRSKQALSEAVVGWGMGKAIEVLSKITLVTGKVVYKSFQSTSIRFSQRSIDADDYFRVLNSMRKNGYDPSQPIDIVRMKDGMYTSLDNTRLLAAQDAGVNIHAVAHNYDDLLDAATKERAMGQYFKKTKKEINTWGEYIEARAKDQGSQWKREFSSGSFNKPTPK